ncbi:putative imidazolonepropionase [Haemaphysalis longicornis]
MADKYRLLVKNARQVVQVVDSGQQCLKGNDMKKLAILQGNDAVTFSIVVNQFGIISAIDKASVISRNFDEKQFEKIVDATGCCVIPGLVDTHTHPVWAGDRVHEFAMKLAGASYLEIHAKGGGIHFTVEHTRAASEDQLVGSLVERLDGMLRSGTTLVEAKSGYGLELDAELKLLSAIEKARLRTPIEISSTYCGAHAVPKGKSVAEATEDIVTRQLPEIERRMREGTLNVENVDVFCEEGVFDVDSSRRILQAGRQAGLRINFHGEELAYIGGAEMGASLGAEAISHLERVSEAGIAAMAEAGTTAVVLPTTAFLLRLEPPPVRRLIEAGVPVSLGSDFNPNAYCFAMPVVMHLACVLCHMSLEEALVAATINGAAVLGRASSHGSLERGKQADMVVLEAPSWEHLVYRLGCHDRLVKYVVKAGRVAHHRDSGAELCM